MRKEVYAGYVPLHIPDWKRKSVEKGCQASCMEVIGELLFEVINEYAAAA